MPLLGGKSALSFLDDYMWGYAAGLPDGLFPNQNPNLGNFGWP
jgi:hypothetical protein